MVIGTVHRHRGRGGRGGRCTVVALHDASGKVRVTGVSGFLGCCSLKLVKNRQELNKLSPKLKPSKKKFTSE